MTFRSREQTAYAALIEGALTPGPPLLAGAAPGLGKTHGYSLPLIRSGRRVAIAMSTRHLIGQYLVSDALAAACDGLEVSVEALQPRREFDSRQEYERHRERALQAQVLLVTHAAALIDSFNDGYADLRSRDVVLFDEADLLGDAAELRSAFVIDAAIIAEYAPKETDPRRAAERVKEAADDAEDRAAASAILYALDHPAWYKEVGWRDKGSLELRHRMPGRMLKPLLRDLKRAIFTSGTLQVSKRFDYFVSSLGLEAIDPASRHIDPVKHGELSVVLARRELTLDDKVSRIREAERPTLVLTTSFDDACELGARLPEAIVRGKEDGLLDALARCPPDGIFISAGAWSGLDDPRLRWRTVVLPKAPYGVPVILDGRSVGRYIDSRVVALRRTSQGLHRGLRTPDARCTLMLLDPRSGRPELREAIPSRFAVDWEGDDLEFEEGDKTLKAHLAGERATNLRDIALRKLGARCGWEGGCDITQKHLLDVHHLKPITEGSRRTTLADVVVLCKNHHAEVHYRLRTGDS